MTAFCLSDPNCHSRVLLIDADFPNSNSANSPTNNASHSASLLWFFAIQYTVSMAKLRGYELLATVKRQIPSPPGDHPTQSFSQDCTQEEIDFLPPRIVAREQKWKTEARQLYEELRQQGITSHSGTQRERKEDSNESFQQRRSKSSANPPISSTPSRPSRNLEDRASKNRRNRSHSIGTDEEEEEGLTSSRKRQRRSSDEESQGLENTSMPMLDDHPSFSNSSQASRMSGVNIPESMPTPLDHDEDEYSSKDASSRIPIGRPYSPSIQATTIASVSKSKKDQKLKQKAEQEARFLAETEANRSNFDDLPNVTFDEIDSEVASKQGASKTSGSGLLHQMEKDGPEKKLQSMKQTSRSKRRPDVPLPPAIQPMPPFSAQTNVTSPGGTSRVQSLNSGSGGAGGSEERITSISTGNGSGSGDGGIDKGKASKAKQGNGSISREEREKSHREELLKAGNTSSKNGNASARGKAPPLEFRKEAQSIFKPPQVQNRPSTSRMAPPPQPQPKVIPQPRRQEREVEEDDSQTEEETSISGSPIRPLNHGKAAEGKQPFRQDASTALSMKQPLSNDVSRSSIMEGKNKASRSVRFDVAASLEESMEDPIEDSSISKTAPEPKAKSRNALDPAKKKTVSKARPRSAKTCDRLLIDCKKLPLNEVVKIFDNWIDSLTSDEKKTRMAE